MIFAEELTPEERKKPIVDILTEISRGKEKDA